MVGAWRGRGMAGVNPHCVNQMGKTRPKPLAARHGRGTAWARYAMCESAFNLYEPESLPKNSAGNPTDVSDSKLLLSNATARF